MVKNASFHSLEGEGDSGWFHTVDYYGEPRQWRDDDDDAAWRRVDDENGRICPPWTLADPLPLEHWIFAPLYLFGCLFLGVGVVILTESAVVSGIRNRE